MSGWPESQALFTVRELDLIEVGKVVLGRQSQYPLKGRRRSRAQSQHIKTGSDNTLAFSLSLFPIPLLKLDYNTSGSCLIITVKSTLFPSLVNSS